MLNLMSLFHFWFQIFEVGDVVFLDATNDVGAVNRRHLAALYCGATSGFEVQIYHNYRSYSCSLGVMHSKISLDVLHITNLSCWNMYCNLDGYFTCKGSSVLGLFFISSGRGDCQ